MKYTNLNVGIISYGCGNVRSVINAVNVLGIQASIIDAPNQLKSFNTIILPGVGSFEFAMAQLHKANFVSAIQAWASSPHNKLIGICLGMQLICSYSEEAEHHHVEGLSLIKASVRKLTASNYDQLPNIGWAEVKFNKKPFLSNTGDYYFVHSYGVFCNDDQNELASSMYGDTTFSSAIQKNNVIGFQFHPEKSHKKGISLLKQVLTT